MALESSNRKFERLLKDLASSSTLLVAFSGGVDSAFLLAAAQLALGNGVTAVTAVSPLFPAREARSAADFCRKRRISQVTFPFEALETPAFLANGPDRCYHCKKALSFGLLKIAEARGIRRVAHGANADDRDDHRPGLRAAREVGIAAPLLDAGLRKEEIRALSLDMGLSTWDRPSRACLASRVPYGVPVTAVRLEQIDRAEAFLEEAGFAQVRVRHHGDVARVEVPKSDIPRFLEGGLSEAVVRALEDAGFLHVTLDLGGYVSGSMNRGISKGKSRREGPPETV